MVHAGNMGTIPLSSTRKIIQALIGTSQQYQPNLRIGVLEFDQNTLSYLIDFRYHADFIPLLNALQTDTDIRISFPRTDISLEYVINSLTQNKSSDVVKAGVVLVDDAAFSQYITSGLAYRAYANGIYMLPIRLITQGSLLTQQDLTSIAYGNAANTFTVDNVAKLGTDALVWLITKFNSCKYTFHVHFTDFNLNFTVVYITVPKLNE